ncbi:NAD(P)-binding protein [Cadophora sp. DSE1049]|nr:NAD(P)-binding protein [Cadophora sp. DSE1049]
MANSTQQIIRSEGMFHGLPTYPKSEAGLTAIVTGANGISGYHMVKVLAAALERWEKIYCLSRRPPPDYFFDGLGEGASRVKHVSADFLDEPENIAKTLKELISHVDHVFFFSYMQPTQKGGILSMWSDADALADVNAKLINNFLQSLRLSNLTPKRVLLQTGAKHYGFHMGPATSPSFETDSRVTLENNFYYPQEDILSAYCKDVGAQWNVVRPSYIIGAVRDNLLNHMVGLAVYCSVQAHLKRPLEFPGDYIAWDREYCQSTAMLNAYLEEWAVLTPEAGNEAFNAQDGLPFTWSRLWPYLANWYGTSWNPPDPDVSKYRSTESRHKNGTPRGYGPFVVVRSTFSFMEWSEQPEVVQAWKVLAKMHNLLLDPFKDRGQIFGITDSAVIGGWALSLSMRKARKMGFHATVDSYESMFQTLHDLAKLHVAPAPTQSKFVEAIQD